MNPLELRYSVNGKLLLCGEHVALMGAGAVGVSVAQKMEAHFIQSNIGFQYESHYIENGNTQIRLSGIDDFLLFVRDICIERKLPVLGKDIQGKIILKSNIPIGSGLGSSAALCTIIAKVILSQTKQISTKKIWYLAHLFEQFFHKNASGIDTALCSYNEALVLIPASLKTNREYPQFIAQKLLQETLKKLHSVYGVIPRTISCSDMIQNVQERLKSYHKIDSFLQETKDMLDVLTHATRQNIVSKVAQHMKYLQEHLHNVGAVSSEMEQIVMRAYQYGACGVKMSGGGGGGAFFCVCQSDAIAHDVVDKLRQNFTNYCPSHIMQINIL